MTAPFLKELPRRAVLLAAEADAAGPDAADAAAADGGDPAAIRVTGAQLTAALDELLAARSQLTLALLGGKQKQ